MKTYEFSVIASGLDPRADDFEARFYDGGCDDALVSFQKGHIILDFSREAETMDEAIASAIEHVRAAGAGVERVEPDPLVSLSDIAARSGMSRAAITHYAKEKRGKGFPAPVAKVTSSSPLWDWASVARWLFRQKRIAREDAIEAEAVSHANRAIEAGVSNVREHLRQRMRDSEGAL